MEVVFPPLSLEQGGVQQAAERRGVAFHWELAHRVKAIQHLRGADGVASLPQGPGQIQDDVFHFTPFLDAPFHA